VGEVVLMPFTTLLQQSTVSPQIFCGFSVVRKTLWNSGDIGKVRESSILSARRFIFTRLLDLTRRVTKTGFQPRIGG